jgi:hypothetical protein
MSTFTTESISVSNLVQNLPQEISLYIYTEFLETECKYEIIMREFRSHRVQRLNSEYLQNMINSHFENTVLIRYLRKREEGFDYYYGKIFLRGEEVFSSMTRNNALVNAWVMSTYH